MRRGVAELRELGEHEEADPDVELEAVHVRLVRVLAHRVAEAWPGLERSTEGRTEKEGRW